VVNKVDQKMRIDILDVRTTPAAKYSFFSPFKRCTYTVDNQGQILFEIVRPLDLMTYDLPKAKKVSALRRVKIEMFDTIGDTEYKVRELGANFKNYILNETPGEGGKTDREEILIFEILEII
jgi:hypothetical protein